MRRVIISLLLLFVVTGVRSQDTASSKHKAFRHELGFNAISLLSIVSIIDPPVQQLPYDVFYNFYFNERVGLRFGTGIVKRTTQTKIPGQVKPRESSTTDLNMRLGATHNFAKAGTVTFNVFADGIWQKFQNKSVTTTTTQVFGDPVLTTTVKSDENAQGFGGQVGLGINWKIYKNMCLYTELPLTFLSTSRKNKDEVSDDGGSSDINTETTTGSEFRFTLPATIYLVLRF